jgi:hypothetical protein
MKGNLKPNLRYTYWFENTLCRPLTEDKLRFDDRDNADFLTEEGQLRYDLNIEIEEFKFFGVNTNVSHWLIAQNQQLYFKQHGTVHHPELLEATLKGYNIDTTDFTINTADNVRFREPNHDQWLEALDIADLIDCLILGWIYLVLQ